MVRKTVLVSVLVIAIVGILFLPAIRPSLNNSSSVLIPDNNQLLTSSATDVGVESSKSISAAMGSSNDEGAYPVAPSETETVNASITTEKFTYLCNETVTINGQSFTPLTAITVTIERPCCCGQHENHIDVFESVVADALGTFTLDYHQTAATGIYNLTAGDGVNSAENSFIVSSCLIWTDEYVYQPNETANIYGAGFVSNAQVNVTIQAPDNSTQTWSVLTDTAGNFTTTYLVEQGAGMYLVFAEDGTNIAITWFADPFIIVTPLWGEVGTMVAVHGFGFWGQGYVYFGGVKVAPIVGLGLLGEFHVLFPVPEWAVPGNFYFISAVTSIWMNPEFCFDVYCPVCEWIPLCVLGICIPVLYCWNYVCGEVCIPLPPIFLEFSSIIPLPFIVEPSAPADIIPPITERIIDGFLGYNEWYTSEVTLRLHANDDYSGVDRTYYRIGETGPYSQYTTPLEFTTDGEYTVYYYSIDKEGNAESPKQIIIKVDRTAPTTEFTPTGTIGLNSWFNSTVIASFEGNDPTPGSGLKTIYYRINDPEGPWIPYATDFDLTDGTYTIEWYSDDLAGNTESPHAVTIRIDSEAPNTAPTLYGNQGEADWYVSDVSLELTATDPVPGSGFWYTEFSYDATTWFSYTEPVAISNEGSTTVYYRSIDQAGNIEEVKSTTIQIDKTAPTTEITFNTYYLEDFNNIFVTSDTIFTLSASDDVPGVVDVSGVKHTYYRINDGEFQIYLDPFSLKGVDGVYTIEFFSIDHAGNEELPYLTQTVTLVSLSANSYLTDSSFNPISFFDFILTKSKEGGYKLVATNPGQFYYNIEITNNWPISLDTLVVEAILPAEFVLKGAMPIHVYLDGNDITEQCTITGTTVTVMNVPVGSEVYIAIHMDFGLKGCTFDTLEDLMVETYKFDTYVVGSTGIVPSQGDGLYGTYRTSNILSAHQKKTTAIAGYITDVDGNPLANLLVELFDSNNNLIGTTLTNDDGFFYFIDISSGDYEIHVNGFLETVSAKNGELTLIFITIENL